MWRENVRENVRENMRETVRENVREKWRENVRENFALAKRVKTRVFCMQKFPRHFHATVQKFPRHFSRTLSRTKFGQYFSTVRAKQLPRGVKARNFGLNWPRNFVWERPSMGA